MAAGREAARAAAIEVISDGLFFFLNGFKVGYMPGCSREQWAGNQQSWRRFRSFTMRHRWAISVRASVALFFFFLGLGNEF